MVDSSCLKWWKEFLVCFAINALQWGHNGCDGVSNHQRRGCLSNRLFRRKSQKTSKLRVTVSSTISYPDQIPARSYAANLQSNITYFKLISYGSWQWQAGVLRATILMPTAYHYKFFNIFNRRLSDFGKHIVSFRWPSECPWYLQCVSN